MKNVTVNDVAYSGISEVQLYVTGGGTANFRDVDEISMPSGTKTITANGTYDVTDFASAEVNVPSEGTSMVLQEKTLTENGTYSPDAGYDGFSQVVVNVSAEAGESAVNGVRYEASVTPASATYNVSFPIVAVPEHYLLKVYAENPENLSVARLVSATYQFDTDVVAAADIYLVKIYTGTNHTAEAPVYTTSSMKNTTITFDGENMTVNFGTYFEKGAVYHAVLIDLIGGTL